MFSKTSLTPIESRNEACMSCHRKDSTRSHWEGSTHQLREVACTSCHQIHTQHDRVREKYTQTEVCFSCHKEQRAMMNRPSRHPIPEGKVVCSDCHNPHGSVGPKLVKRDSVNDTCYTCHMEKRGPFVHNHEPVAEDCMNCHNPHGTVVENLLKARAPFLCHQCHTPHGANVPQLLGRQVVPNSVTTTGKNAVNITQGRGCLNCHTYLGQGAGNLGAPDLSAIGATNDAAYFVQYLTNPAAFGNTVMGSYSYLGEENLAALGEFLASSKGSQGGD